MPKVRGNRMATPLAPPRPGSTPMITPRITPANINNTFLNESATANPCNSDWISSMSVQPEEGLDRTLGQRDLEPDLEDDEEKHAVSDTDRRELPPIVLAQPAHEETDEQDRRNVDSQPADERDVDRTRHQNREHQLELLHLDEGAVLLRRNRHSEIDDRREADQQADIEGEVARLRTVIGPVGAQAHAVPHDDRADREEERRGNDLGALLAKRNLSRAGTLGHCRPPDVLTCRRR